MRNLKPCMPVRRTLLFFLVTFGFSWSLWIPLAVSGRESPVLDIAGRFGPLVAALLVTARDDGRAGLRKLLSGMLIWRVRPGWYAFAFLSTAVIVLAAIGVHVALGGGRPAFNDPSQLYLVIPVFLYVLVLSVAGEETGWRGYALPRLQERWGPLRASLVIGFVWGCWHLPLFWMPGNFHTGIPLGLFILQDVALSVVLTWLFNATGGSLLIVHLFHAASNTTLGVLPVLPQDTGGDLRPLWIAVGLLCAFAVVLAVRRMEKRRPTWSP
jgi:membrane protease YdiL (CAAX protease family)